MKVYRGSILHFLDNPESNYESSYEYIKDGLLVLDSKGKIKEVGEFQKINHHFSIEEPLEYVNYSDYLIIPGFIDSHIHFPQLEMIASYSGGQLLEWLERCVFATENEYKNFDYSKAKAEFFLRTLIKNGTTSALVFTSVHKASTEAFFECAENLDMLMISGQSTDGQECTKIPS